MKFLINISLFTSLIIIAPSLSNANCLPKYDELIKKSKVTTRALQAQLQGLEYEQRLVELRLSRSESSNSNSAVLMVFLASFLIIPAGLAITQGAAIAPFVIASGLISGGSYGISRVESNRGVNDTPPAPSRTIKEINAEIVTVSRAIIEHQYNINSLQRIRDLVDEVGNGVEGKESRELVRRLQGFVLDRDGKNIADQDIYRAVKSADEDNLLCVPKFEISSVFNIENGIKESYKNPNSNSKIKNPYIRSEVESRLESIQYQTRVIDKEIQILDEMKAGMSQNPSLDDLVSMADSTGAERLKKVESLIEYNKPIDITLRLVIRANMSLGSMKEKKRALLDIAENYKKLIYF